MFKGFWWAAGIVLLAGCGGGGSSAPGAPPGPTPTPPSPPGSSTQGTLYVAGNSDVVAFPITAHGSVTPSLALDGLTGASSGSGNWTRVAGVAGIGTTFLISIQGQVAGNPQQPTQWYCNLDAFSVSAGSFNQMSSPSCPGDLYAAVVVAQSNGGYDYLSYPYSGSSQVVRIHPDGSAVVRLTAPSGQSFDAFAEDRFGNVYVASGSTVFEYAGTTDVVPATPMRSISTSASPVALAVAPDGTIYAGANGPPLIMAISAQGSTRTFGSYAAGVQIAGLATDSAGDVYVGFNGPNQGQTEVDTFAPNSNTPMRVLVNPVPNEIPYPKLEGIAVAQ